VLNFPIEFGHSLKHIWKVSIETASCPQTERVYFCAVCRNKSKCSDRAFVINCVSNSTDVGGQCVSGIAVLILKQTEQS
jgi:hypothetical protein